MELINLVLALALALVLTIIIELGVAFLLNHKSKEKILAVVGVNLITNPALNFLIQLNSQLSMIQLNFYSILVLEIMVTVIEFLILAVLFKKERKQMLLLAVAMNITSFVIGLILFQPRF